MKKKALLITLAALITASAAAVTALAAPGGTGAPLYENVREITDGFYFTNTISLNSENKRMETFALEVSPDSDVYPIVLAEDMIYSKMDIDQMTAWAKEQGWNVYGAVNADFFYSTMSMPIGGLIQNGEYISSMNGENLLAFTDSGAFFSPMPEVEIKLQNSGGGSFRDPETGITRQTGASEMSVYNLNEMRNLTGGLYIYTSAYHNVSTNTFRPGWGVRFKVLSGRMTVSGTMELEVVDVIPDGTDYALGEGYMVLTAPADSKEYADYWSKFAVGDKVTLTTTCTDQRIIDAKWATGCGDLLVENGAMTDPEGWDQALIKVHPRTAVGIKADGSIVAYVIDGRLASYSNGATLEELATDLISMGCVTAVNLDGGGSSMMSVRAPGSEACTVVNRPSDGKLREVSSYILFVSDMKPDGVPARLHLEGDGAMVFTGSSLPLKFTATDASGMPAPVPEDATAFGALGDVTGGVYTAGLTPGRETLTLQSFDLTGRGSVTVVDRLDTLTITDAETSRAPAFTELEPGCVFRLQAAGTYLNRSVAIDNQSVAWSVTEGLGEITPDGVFTMTGGLGATGEITAQAGGITVKIPVTTKEGLRDISGHWAEQYIRDLYSMGVVTGTGDLTFKPDNTIGRCDFVLMLWRALGSPVIEPEEGQDRARCSFTDVSEDSYYYDAVVWAERIGLSNGTGDGLFAPTGPLTREQAFTLVHRLLSVMRRELPEPDDQALLIFSDSAQVDDFAYAAMASLTRFGMISGSDGKCFPLREITRGEMAKILYTALY